MTYRKRVAPGVYRSEKGRYSIRYKVDGQVVDRGGYRTLEEARTARTRALADASRGIKQRPKRTTVQQYYDEWLPRYSRTVRPLTAKAVESAVRNHVLPTWGSTALDSLSPRPLQRWIDEVHDRVPGATRGVHNALSLLLQDAVHYEVLFRNPMRSVKAPQHRPRARSTLSATELSAYLTVAPAALCWVALTGCRVGEMRGMRWRDVNEKAWVVTATWSGSNSNRPDRPKTPSSFRVVPVTPALEALLPPRDADGVRVWGDVSYNTRRREHLVACKAIGVTGVTIHDLRHTWASIALVSGVHPKLVQQQLGHAKIGITLDTYSHVMPEHSRAAAEAVESALQRPAGEGFVGGTAREQSPE